MSKRGGKPNNNGASRPKTKSNKLNSAVKNGASQSTPASAMNLLRLGLSRVEHLVSADNQSSPLVPGLPPYCCKSTLVVLLQDTIKTSHVAHTYLGQNPLQLCIMIIEPS